MRKRVFGDIRTAKTLTACAFAQSGQGYCCLLTETFDTIECINGGQMPKWDFAHARDKSESGHFAHVVHVR